MTLTKKMALGVLGSLILIFIVTYTITLINNRHFFVEQMNSSAQDTATALGLSISQADSSNDKTMMLSMVRAVFDRGYFSKIEIRDTDNKIMISRYLSDKKVNVPDWFIRLIHLPVKAQSATIMKGWLQVGSVMVVSDPGYAYEALWKSAIYLIGVYIIFAILALTLVFLFIQWLMKPLKKLTKQAASICKKLYPIETDIPKTFELKQVTLAMNQMVSHIKALFEEQVQQIEILQKRAFQDSLTAIGNRHFFLQQLEDLLNNKEEYRPGYLILIAIDGLDKINKAKGYRVGDKVILMVARACNSFWGKRKGVDLGRISGSNFALIVREEQEKSYIENFLAFNELLQALPLNEWGCAVYMSTSSYSLRASTSDLLRGLDNLLLVARKMSNRAAISEALSVQKEDPLTEDFIHKSLTNKNFALYGQWIKVKDKKYHQELFIRLLSENMEICAGRFMPLAEKLGLSAQIDDLVLETVLDQHYLEKHAVALNLSEMTIINKDKRDNYLKKIANLSWEQRKNLFLEIKESIIVDHFEAVKYFALSLNELAVHVGIDQVGVHFSSKAYLHQLPIHYLKLHGSLLEDIDENQNKQFLLHYFLKLAKILNIQVIITRVENEKQWTILRELGFSYGQGEFLDPPKLLKIDPKAHQR